MTTQRKTSEQHREARKIGAALEAVASLMDEGSSFAYSAHDVPVESFSDRRVNLGGVMRRRDHSMLYGDLEHGGVTVRLFSVHIPITSSETGDAGAPADA